MTTHPICECCALDPVQGVRLVKAGHPRVWLRPVLGVERWYLWRSPDGSVSARVWPDKSLGLPSAVVARFAR